MQIRTKVTAFHAADIADTPYICRFSTCHFKQKVIAENVPG